MTTGDLVTIYGRCDVGRVIAMDCGPDDFDHDRLVDYVHIEFETGREWHRANEVSSHRKPEGGRILGAPPQQSEPVRIEGIEP